MATGMAISVRLPGALVTLIYLHFFSRIVFAQNGTAEPLPTFGDTIQILGAMERTDQDFKDGLALELFSPKNRTLVVKQNTFPLGAQFVTGNSGSPFIALSNYSYIITMNETANDLMAKIDSLRSCSAKFHEGSKRPTLMSQLFHRIRSPGSWTTLHETCIVQKTTLGSSR